MSLNARSIINKIDLFKTCVYDLQPDIIGVTESWASDSIFDSELHIDGYHYFRCDRSSGNRGGGVLLYVKEVLKPTEFHTSNKYGEHIWCSIGDLLVGVCYRSSNLTIVGHDNETNLKKVLQEVSNKHVLILGDFNYPDVDWSTYTASPGSSMGCVDFIQTIEDCFYTQHVHQPTRGTSILDLILSSDPDLVSNVQVLCHLGNSDHNMLTFTVHHEYKCPLNIRTIRNFHKGDYDSIRKELSAVNWDTLLSGNMEVCWNKFKYLLFELVNKYIPATKSYDNGRMKKPIWMSHKALKAVKRKNKVFKKYKDKAHPAIVRANKTATKELKNAKHNFEKKLAENIKKDKKSFYAYNRSKSKTKVQVGNLLTSNGVLVTDDQTIVECYNNFFASVFTKDDLRPVAVNNMMKDKNVESSVTKLELDVEKILKAIAKLKPDKSQGPDELSPKLLIETGNEIAYPLLLLFSKSLNESTVPQEWKRANVTPIFKKGSRNCMENYRPVSLTSQVCKLFETIIRDNLVHHLERNQLIASSQHGFRKGRSCLSNLLEFLDKVTGCIDDGDSVDVIFLDFAKAFDKVSHRRLILKLRAHHIDEKLINWIAAWLNNRVQRVCIRGVASNWLVVLSGVPQGSVLGPLLFLIYINDLDYGIKNWILKFADDTKLFGKIRGTSDVIKLQDDLDQLLQWAEEWQMLFNTEKCKVMHIGSCSIQRQYCMANQQLDVVNQEKDLGVTISSDLKVSLQCKQAYNKASRILGLINRTIEYRETTILLRLYKSLVRPHLEYCVPAWSPHYVKDKVLIEKIQRRFSRMIPSIRKLSYEDRLKELGLWSLEDRRVRADLIEVYKIIHGISSVDPQTFFELSTHNRTRGHPLKLNKNRVHTELRQHFFTERVVNIWNKLDEKTVSASSLNGFKQQLERHYKDGSLCRLFQSV